MLMLKQFYINLIQNPQLLRIGDQLIYQKLVNKENRGLTIELIASQAEFNLVILTQNILARLWPQLQQSQKFYIRKRLLQAVIHHSQNLKYLQALAILITKIHNVEGYEIWVQLYNLLISSQFVPYSIKLQYFLIVMRSADDRINILAPILLPFLGNILIKIPQNQISSGQKVLILTYEVIKSFSMLSSTDQLIIERSFNGTFQNWISMLNQILLKHHKQLEKFTLKILTVLYSDLPKYMNKTTNNIIFTILRFFNNRISQYLSENVFFYQKRYYYKSQQQNYIYDINFEQSNWSEGIIYQSLELIESIVIQKRFKTYNTFGNYILLNNLYNILLVSQADQKLWLSDPNKFIAETEDESTVSIRNRVLSFISIILEKSSESIEILKIIIQNGFSGQDQVTLKNNFQKSMKSKNILSKLDLKKMFSLTYQQLNQIFQTSFLKFNQNSTWRRKEASFLLLNTFTQDLLNLDFNKTDMIKLLSYQIANSQHPLVKVQALKALVRFCQSIQPHLYPQLLDYSKKLLKSEYLGLKIMAVKAIGVFSRNIRLNKNKKDDFIQGQISEIINLIANLSNDTIHVMIDTCIQISRYSSNANKLISKHILPFAFSLFQNFYNDSLLSSMIVELFVQISSKQLQEQIMKKILEIIHIVQYQQLVKLYLKLIEKSIRNHTIQCDLMNLIIFVKLIAKYEIAQDLITSYIHFAEIDQELFLLLQINMNKKWIITLHRRGFPINLLSYLNQSIQKVIQVSSQFELQSALIIPIYVLYKSFNQTIKHLKQVGIYKQFFAKWIKYSTLFKGQLLIKASVIILSKLDDPVFKNQIEQFIQNNKIKLNIEIVDSQWVNEEGSDDDDIYKQYEGYDEYLINERVEQQLKVSLPELSTHQFNI